MKEEVKQIKAGFDELNEFRQHIRRVRFDKKKTKISVMKKTTITCDFCNKELDQQYILIGSTDEDQLCFENHLSLEQGGCTLLHRFSDLHFCDKVHFNNYFFGENPKKGNEVLADVSGSLLQRAISALDDYLNAGCKEKRGKADEKAKFIYKEYYGVDYVNRNDR